MLIPVRHRYHATASWGKNDERGENDNNIAGSACHHLASPRTGRLWRKLGRIEQQERRPAVGNLLQSALGKLAPASSASASSSASSSASLSAASLSAASLSAASLSARSHDDLTAQRNRR